MRGVASWCTRSQGQISVELIAPVSFFFFFFTSVWDSSVFVSIEKALFFFFFFYIFDGSFFEDQCIFEVGKALDYLSCYYLM